MKKLKHNEKVLPVILITLLSLFFLSFFLTVASRTYKLHKKPFPVALSESEKREFLEVARESYAENVSVLQSLPYEFPVPSFELSAESAILIDAGSGYILFEKDADTVIPPASLTKLFLMYLIFDLVDSGEVSLESIVPLPKEAWAASLPPHSSLMFLGSGQTVSVRELLVGLSVASGNDAARALAIYAFGSEKAALEKMNSLAKSLNLTHTYFEEVSGLSEKNRTTARELATFTRLYLSRHPESLAFHSALSISYPAENNIAPADRGKGRVQSFSSGIPENIYMTIYQANTNPLLGKLEGVDGVKTGYIDESGYNLVLTAKRGNSRYISVTLRGKGANNSEGQAGRVHDGTLLMEWAFSTFFDYENPLLNRTYSVPLLCSSSTRLLLLPAFFPKTLTVPRSFIKNFDENMLRNEKETRKLIRVTLRLPEKVFCADNMKVGDAFGRLNFIAGNSLLLSIPLISGNEPKRAGLWERLSDTFVQFSI